MFVNAIDHSRSQRRFVMIHDYKYLPLILHLHRGPHHSHHRNIQHLHRDFHDLFCLDQEKYIGV